MQIWTTFFEQFGGWVGLIASITGLISVYYAVKNNILTWPTGIISVILFGWVFWVTKAYSNAWLQIFYYLPISFYGWYVWLRCGPTHKDDLPITLLSPRARIGWTAITIVASLVWGYYENKYTNAPMPWCDAGLTVISIVAQYLQTRKFFENWILWIVADIVYTFYFLPRQELKMVAGLYGVFLIMAALGGREWLRIMRLPQQKTVSEEYEERVVENG
ncbi:MAG TPA: nicotinamide riboside transporter PnuC [Chthonomonadaceae bacterium]|nr:nicotinamide riboside transporter PnuC [Chthonomonadaceae bacterium]